MPGRFCVTVLSMTIDLTGPFRTWWENAATDAERSQLRAIAEDGNAPVTGDLLDTMMRNRVALVGTRWVESDLGYTFYLTSGMEDLILAPEQRAT